MKKKKMNRKEWRRKTSLFLAVILGLQVFTGNIAGVRALELPSGEERIADEADSYEAENDAESYDDQVMDEAEDSGDTAVEADADDSIDGEVSDNENSGADSEKDSVIADGADSNSDNVNNNGSAEDANDAESGSESENGSSIGKENGAGNETGADSGSTGKGDSNSGVSDSTKQDGTAAADETTSGAENTETSAAESGSTETSAAETGSAETSAAETSAAETSAAETSAAETSVAETTAAQTTLFDARSGETIDVSGVSGNIYLYTANKYQLGKGDITNWENGTYVLSGKSTSSSVIVGDSKNGGTEDSATEDLYVDLDALTLSKELTVYPLGTLNESDEESTEAAETEIETDNGIYTLKLSVSGQSEIGKLVIEKNAKVEITLSQGAGLKVGSVSMGEGSFLTVHAGNKSAATAETEPESDDVDDTAAEAAVAGDGGIFTVTGSFTGDGTVVFDTATDGHGEVHLENGMSVRNITFTDVDITAGKKELTAAGTFTVRDSKISNASLLGFAADAAEEKTLVLDESDELSDVSTVGTSASGHAVVTIDGIPSTIANAGTSTTAFYEDHKIYYFGQDDSSEEITADAAWPVTYRIKTVKGGKTETRSLTGSHTCTDGTYKFTAGTSVKLPVYTMDGYQYAGWKMDQSDEPAMTELGASQIDNLGSDLKLYLSVESDPVTVITDLGYEPTKDTNDEEDLSQENTVATGAALGDKVQLKSPTRFGYEFKGWKVATRKADASEKIISSEEYEIVLEDTEVSSTSTNALKEMLSLFATSESVKRTVKLVAQWEAKSYEIRFYTSASETTVPAESIRVYNPNNELVSLQELADRNDDLKWDGSSSMLRAEIFYDESLPHFFERIGLKGLPQLFDSRSGAARLDFAGWSTPSYQAITDPDKMTFSINSILDNRQENQSLNDYDEAITRTPVILTARWGTASYTLKTDVVSGWTVLVDGKVQTQSLLSKFGALVRGKTTMELKVDSGSTVTYRCSATTPQQFSFWSFTDDFWPKEQPYTSGAAYLEYSAEMPAHDVIAENCASDLKNLYIDLYESSIVFEENVTLPSTRTASGFWYGEKMKKESYDDSTGTSRIINAMTPVFQAEDEDQDHPGEYFYLWNAADEFHVTTQKKWTQNQLVLVKSTNIALVDCLMQIREDYSEYFNGMKVDLDGAGTASSPAYPESTGAGSYFDPGFYNLANIMIKGAGNPTINITLAGEHNVIGMVGSDETRDKAKTDNRNVNFTGEGKDKTTVYFGTITGSNYEKFTGLKIKSYNAYEDHEGEDTSSYLSYTFSMGTGHSTGTVFVCKDSIIETPDKAVLYMEGDSSLTGTKAELLGIYGVTQTGTYGPVLYGASYLRIRKDIAVGRYTIRLNGSSSAVVDGSLIAHTPQGWSQISISTTGYLIVKGSRCDLEQLSVANGTIIANVIGIYGRGNIQAGANIYTNAVIGVQFPVTLGSCLKLADSGDEAGADYEVRAVSSTNTNALSSYYPITLFHVQNIIDPSYMTINGSVYLTGYLESETWSGYKLIKTTKDYCAQGSDNPLSGLITEVIDPESGDLKVDSTTGAELKKLAVDKIKEQSTPDEKKAECISWGDWRDAYNKGSEQVKVTISGNAKVYAAGNLNFLNEVTVNGTGPEIWCGGTFSSMRGLNIASGTITADQIGIRGANRVGDDGKQTYGIMNVTGGNLNTDQIGALQEGLSGYTGQKNRAKLIMTEGTLKSRTDGSEIKFLNDTYLNYQTAEEIEFEKNPEDLRFRKTDASGSTYRMQEEISLPELSKNGTKLSTGYWGLDNLDGTVTTAKTISAEGTIKDSANTKPLYELSYVSLMPYESNKHKVKLTGLDSDFGTVTVVEKDASGKEISRGDLLKPDDFLEVSEENTVTLILSNPEVRPYLIASRTDSARNIYNMLENDPSSDGSVSFTMDRDDVDVSLTREYKLDLAYHDYYLTNGGFGVDTTLTSDKRKYFSYAGSLTIIQSTAAELWEYDYGSAQVIHSNEYTPHVLKFETGFENKGRTIKLKDVVQKYDVGKNGVELGTDSKLQLDIEGKVSVNRFYVADTTSELTIQGQGPTTTTFGVTLPSGASNATGFGIGNDKNLQAGKSITVKDARIRISAGRFVRGGTGNKTTLTIDNCIWNTSDKTSSIETTNDYNLLAEKVENVVLKDFVWRYSHYANAGVREVKNVTLKGRTIIDNQSGSNTYTTFGILYGITGNVTIAGESKLNLYYSKASSYIEGMYTTYKPEKIVVTDNAAFNIQTGRLRLRDLEVLGNGSVYVADGDGTWNKPSENYKGYLMARNITVGEENGGSGANIQAGTVLVSGYYQYNDNGAYDSIQTEDHFKNLPEAAFVDGSGYNGLELKNGTINADIVGGDKNGKLKVSGGTLTATTIGTTGYYYGYTQRIGLNPTVYRRDALNDRNSTVQAAVNVTGGTVNVKEGGTLGGMNATVNISGGQVNLADGAVVGMSDEQRTKLTDHYSAQNDDIANHSDKNINVKISGGSVESDPANGGKILAPYGQVEISGDGTKVKVKDLCSDFGTVEIRGAKNGYGNPYKGNEMSQYKSDQIGVWVTDQLSARDLTITDGAQVYAQNAYAEVDSAKKGQLTVKKSGLYSPSYGEKGIVRNESEKQYVDTFNDPYQTVFGTSRITVVYELNPQQIITESDVPTIVNDNPDGYPYKMVDDNGKNLVHFKNAECKGYRFIGWYTDRGFTDQPISERNTELGSSLTLYAKWEKIGVTFRIRMPKGMSEAEFDGLEDSWMQVDGRYVSTSTVTIPYGDLILGGGSNRVNLNLYTTVTLGIASVEIADTGTVKRTLVTPDQTIVSKALAEEYRALVATDPKAVVYLDAYSIPVRRAILTLDMNKDAGKPKDAGFQNESTPSKIAIDVDKPLSAYAEIIDPDAAGKSQGLVKPSATGYTFIGWNTNPKADENTSTGWLTQDSYLTEITTAYAIWKANTYLVRFNAGEGNWVTAENQEPESNEVSKKTLDYYWVYDKKVSENVTYEADDGSKKEISNVPYAWREGYVFENSSDWSYTVEGSDVPGYINSETVLSKSSIGALNTDLIYTDENSQPALTLTATYRPVKVTYYLNGGTFTESVNAIVKPDRDGVGKYADTTYGVPLFGYTMQTDGAGLPDGAECANGAAVAGANGKNYWVLSTTAEHFADKKQNIPNDYREKVGYKGYTFRGWFTADEQGNPTTEMGTAPRFKDAVVYAKWEANRYKLTLNAKKDGENYAYTTFEQGTSAVASPVTGIEVKVGDEINVTGGWPGRSGEDAWYALNLGTAEPRRNLLGFTFAALDPGSSEKDSAGYQIYEKYEQSIVNLQNGNRVFLNREGQTAGTVFRLPENTDYRDDISGSYVDADTDTYEIPDYPNGSTIQMYGIYRENSLIFVERYVDADENVHENIVHTASWENYSDYPSEEYYPDNRGKGNPDITKLGYTLVGWYVNTTSADDEKKYPANSNEYANKKQKYAEEAKTLGTYDIKVYTVYAAQVKKNIDLNALEDPTVEESKHSLTQILQNSIQRGRIGAKLTGNKDGLKFVKMADMIAHQYDETWGTGGAYTSDNTVAVVVTVKDLEGNTASIDLADLNLNAADATWFKTENETPVEIGAKNEVTFTLYHSRVMTQKQTYPLTLDLLFDNSTDTSVNTLKEQMITESINVNLTPSMYEVTYTVKLPEEKQNLTVGGWGDFVEPTDTAAKQIEKTAKIGYGSDLISSVPEIEGYGYPAPRVWKVNRTDAGDTLYKKLEMPVDASYSGKIPLVMEYTAKEYTLSAASEVLKYWKIEYTDGVGNTTYSELSSPGNVKYHSSVRFVPKDAANSDYPEFVTLTFKSEDGTTVVKTEKLSGYGTTSENGNVWTFTMPANNINADRSDVETLYLENGTITIWDGRYHQDRTDREPIDQVWRGNYVILQNAANSDTNSTPNVLILNDDLSDRKIQLGNLNISSADSIRLAENAKADLTVNYDGKVSNITAKNILAAGTGTKLTMHTGIMKDGSEDSENQAVINLEPNGERAAIGGGNASDISAAIGSITIDNLDIRMKMPAGSYASGIGSGTADSSSVSGNVTVKNSKVSVTEGQLMASYSGAWIGGAGVENVSIENSTITRGGTNVMAGPVITDGEYVTVSNSKIGTSNTEAVSDPVYARASLTIENSEIYQSIQSDLTGTAATVSAPIGTAVGTATIKNSIVNATVGGAGSVSDLYSGKLVIDDAVSDVFIKGT